MCPVQLQIGHLGHSVRTMIDMISGVLGVWKLDMRPVTCMSLLPLNCLKQCVLTIPGLKPPSSESRPTLNMLTTPVLGRGKQVAPQLACSHVVGDHLLMLPHQMEQVLGAMQQSQAEVSPAMPCAPRGMQALTALDNVSLHG